MSLIHWVTRGCEYLVVYYKSRKRELEIRLMNESRYEERLNARVQEATCLTYTGLKMFIINR
jgi:hypothetical protein